MRCIDLDDPSLMTLPTSVLLICSSDLFFVISPCHLYTDEQYAVVFSFFETLFIFPDRKQAFGLLPLLGRRFSASSSFFTPSHSSFTLHTASDIISFLFCFVSYQGPSGLSFPCTKAFLSLQKCMTPAFEGFLLSCFHL